MEKTLYRKLLKKLEEEEKKASKKSSTPIIKKKEEEDSQKAATILSTQNKPSIYTDTQKQSSFGTVKNVTPGAIEIPKASQVISATADTPAEDKPVQKNESSETIREASQIKDRVASALEKKYGPVNTKGIFDSIDDDTVEKNVDVANASIKASLKNGSITNEQFKKFPYMREGLTLFYAASEKGNKTAANKAYEAAYTEEDSKTKNVEDYKVESIIDEPKITDETYANKSEKNNDSIYFPNTKFSESNLQRVYHGDTWLGEPQLDLNYGNMSKEELSKMKWIRSDEIDGNEKAHIATWRWLANATSTGEMQGVVNDMITHFLDGTGTEYRNPILTKYVAEHKTTKAYMSDFTKVFKEFLEKNNGNYKDFPYTQDFKDALENNGVLLSTYAYNETTDNFKGLRMAIHSWTESDVDVVTFKTFPDGTYYGKLKFTFIDNFGLNSPDIDKFGVLSGFRSWYILQHYDKYEGKYKPFRTIVTIDYPFMGKL